MQAGEIYATCHRVTKNAKSIEPSSFAALKFMGVLKRLADGFFLSQHSFRPKISKVG